MTRFEIESWDELRLLTDALLATRPEAEEVGEDDEPVAEEIDPLIEKILSQAEQDAVAPYSLELADEEADRLAESLEAYLDAAAETGDVFQTGEIEGLMRRLGRG
ncbi:MAG: hypothetical protein FJZ01_27260 [Candidatus Sericytochromatia bacterium]|nr:hypothetical protein [Candidatus Tanganyikabacteria bacterium]